MKDKEVKEKREDPPEACLDVEFIHPLSHSVKKNGNVRYLQLPSPASLWSQQLLPRPSTAL